MTAATVHYYSSIFPSIPAPVAVGWQEFAGNSGAACPNSNFLKGVRWSPDGSCCLTVGDDNWLRVFDLPQQVLQQCIQQQQQQQYAAEPGQAPGPADPQNMAAAAAAAGGGGVVDTELAAAAAAADETAAAAGSQWQSGLQVHAGETVYDYAWFSGMSAADPLSCCFASSSRGQPVKVWDACTGALRASYRSYDDADEITAATSIAFSPDGSLLVAGYNKALRVFNVSRPGRDCRKFTTHKKRQEGSMPGIVSCIAFNTVQQDLMAAGSYGRGIGLFDARTFEQLLLLEGHTGGVTQVSFSPDGNFLYSGARRDDVIHCWDVRSTGQALYSLKRCSSATNQRIGFSIEPCGRHLATGGCDGFVRVFDLRDGQLVGSFRAASDTVNGVDFSPCLNLLVTASGHRRYHLPLDTPEDEGEVEAAASGGWSSSSSSRKRLRGAAGNAAPGTAVLSAEAADDDDCLSVLSLSTLQPGGLCNSLRLWKVDADWVAAAAAAAEEATLDAAAGAAVAMAAPTSDAA